MSPKAEALASHTPRGQATRRRLLDAARAIIVERDGGMELGEVARRAGVSPGLPYRYFESKSALLVAVVEELFDDLDAAVYRPSFEELSEDWWERETIRVARLVAFFYDEPLGPLVVAQLAGDAAVAEAKHRRVRRQVEGASRNIALGQKLGRVPARVDAELVGAIIIGGVHQAIAAALTRKPRMRKTRVTQGLIAFVRGVLQLEEGP
ncbi:MAG: TetR/AcrR family transcriptional regulator [Myxococcales bacterium]|nr:TetR/AcrR family transcriptional regulator [Myxococcales bacterium]